MTAANRDLDQAGHDYTHCKHHGPRGGLLWCAKCPVCRPKRKKAR